MKKWGSFVAPVCGGKLPHMLLRVVFHGQGEVEAAVFSVLAVYPDLFMVRVYDGFGDEESKTHAVFVQASAFIALIEALEDVGQILF